MSARNANLNFMIDVIETPSAYLFISDKKPYNLRDLLKFSKKHHEDLAKLFLLYQLLNVVNYCHEYGICHGSLDPSKILLSENKLWIYLCGLDCPSSLEANPTTDTGTIFTCYSNIFQGWITYRK